MRLIIIGLLVIAALWVLVAGLRNHKRVSFFALFILLAPAAIAGYFEYKWVEAQDQISIAVSEVSGVASAKLECQRMSEAFFDAWQSRETISDRPTIAGLKANTCSQLIGWHNDESNIKPTSDQIEAIHLLTRETMRISGQTTFEAQECSAIVNTINMAIALGASPDEANYIHLYYLQNIYPEVKISKKIYC